MLTKIGHIYTFNLIDAIQSIRILDQQINYGAAPLLVTRGRLSLNQRLNECLDLRLPRLQCGKDLTCD
jgi:hypothetical protein